MPKPSPLAAARQWAKEHPDQTAVLCVVNEIAVGGVQRHNRLGKEAGYFGEIRTRRRYYRAVHGAVSPLPPSHPIANAITIDLRPPAPHCDPKLHEQIWATMHPTDEIAACPTCGAKPLDVRRERHYRYVKCDACGLAPVTATEPRDAESAMLRAVDRYWAQLLPTRETAPCPHCGQISKMRRQRGGRGYGEVFCCGAARVAAMPAQAGHLLFVADLPAPQPATPRPTAPQPTAEPTPVERVAQLITRRDRIYQIKLGFAKPSEIVTKTLAEAVVAAWGGQRREFPAEAQAAAARFIEVAKREGYIE